MALNFPDNPQTGDTYLAPNNQLYLYDGEKWIGFVTPAGTIAQGITFVGDDSTGTRVSDNETIKIAGSGSVTTSVSGDTITITGSPSAQGITFVGDDSSGTRVSDGETIKIAGTQNITTAVSGDTLTITGPNLSSYLTNSTLTVVGDDSTGVTLNSGETIKIAGSGSITTAVSGDTLTITGSASAQGITFVGDDSTGTRVSDGETIKIAGTQNVSTAVSGDTLTITGSKNIEVNEISSGDSSAIQINDGLNIQGNLTVNGNLIYFSKVGAYENYISLYTGENNPNNSYWGFSASGGYGHFQFQGDIERMSGANLRIAEGGGALIDTANGRRLIIHAGDADGYNYADLYLKGANVTVETNGVYPGRGTFTVDGIQIQSNTLSTNSSNQNLELDAAGSGTIELLTNTNITGNIISTGTITGSNTNITVVGDDSTGTTFNIGETIKIAGTQNVSTAVSGDTLTITGSKDINVNSITSSDSSAIQINDAVNISGAVTANAGLTVSGAINGLGNSKLDFNTYGANTAYLTTTSDDTTALFMGAISAELYAQTNILIRTNTDETAKVWTFGDDGSVTFPDSTTQNTAASITIVGDDSTGVTLNAGETIKIAGAGSITTAVSGDTITITGTGGGASIGDLTVDGTTISSGSSSKITLNESVDITGILQVNDINSADSSAIQINDSLNASGTITATTFVTHGTGGSITGVNTLQVNEISSGDSTAIQINDGVNISGTLNAKTLIANTISSEDSTAIQINDGLRISGDLTFSNNTVQTTAYVTASGNWTVTTGTNTYSFTVPQDGTYTMWVKGNIANGIIIWNATVSVSNTNVAAIGYQYAWNYTGGGSPISFTAIPDQIRGTAGTISTDATYVGSTSNRFDFGISNTSGASQTVYYGYAKIA